MRRELRHRRARVRRLGAGVRALERVAGDARNRRHADLVADQRARHLAHRAPSRPADRPATAACRDSGRASRCRRSWPDSRWTRCPCRESATGSSSDSRCAESARDARCRKSACRPVSRGCRPSARPALSVPTCSTLAAGIAIVGPAAVVERVGVRNERAQRVVAAARGTARRDCGATRPARARDRRETPARAKLTVNAVTPP